MTLPSYHDLHITTATTPRTSISALPYGHEVTCTRPRGWSLWAGNGSLLAGEFEGPSLWLVLDVAGHVILDSRTQPEGVGR